MFGGYFTTYLTAYGTPYLPGSTGMVPGGQDNPAVGYFTGYVTPYATPYLPGSSGLALPVDPDPEPLVRDWDVYIDIAAKLRATGGFSQVNFSDDEALKGFKAEEHAVAVIVPGDGDESDYLDDPGQTQWRREVSWALVVYSKGKTPMLRDSEAERLGNIAKIALDFKALAGATICQKTKFLADRLIAADPPFRKLRLSGTFSYYVNGPAGRSTRKIT